MAYDSTTATVSRRSTADPNAGPQPTAPPPSPELTPPAGQPYGTVAPPPVPTTNQGPANGPNPGPNPGNPRPVGPTTDPIAIRNWILKFTNMNPGANPSTRNDTDYWVRRILETHPNGNIDWGYWEGRFMQPEGPPEGSRRTPTPPPTGAYNPVDPNLTGNYGDVLNLVKQRFQEWYGRPITDEEIRGLQTRFGYVPDTPASGGELLKANRLDPSQTGSGEQALQYLNSESTRLRGRPLNQDEINWAINKIGYQQGQPVTGAQVNTLLDQLDTLATNRSPQNPGNTVTYHGSDVNKVLEYLYNNRNTRTGGNTPPPNGNTPPPGGNPPPGGGNTPPPGGAGNRSLYQALIQLLTGRATQSLNIDPLNDSIIRPQVDAARVQMERQGRDALNDMAESSDPYATGARNTARTQLAERTGQGVSQLQSQLVQNELTARRQEIQSALGQMGGLLTEDERIQLQRQLGLIDAALRQQGITNQNDQFLRNLLLQYNYLNSQNDQFAANYNLNATDRANYWDALRRGLL